MMYNGFICIYAIFAQMMLPNYIYIFYYVYLHTHTYYTIVLYTSLIRRLLMSTLQEFGKASFQRDIAELKKAANFNSRRGRGVLVDGNGCKHWILTQKLRDNSDNYNYNYGCQLLPTIVGSVI